MKRNILWIALTICILGQALAQTTIRGKVIDEKDNELIAATCF